MAAKPEPVRTELADEDEGDGRERRAPRLRRLPPGIFAPLAAIVLAVLAAMAVMTWLAMRHNQMGREVSRLTTEKVRLNDLNRRLRADMDALTVLEDLETVARERLGLVSPSQGQIEIIE
jgi:cell division protein FtsL